MAEFTINDLYNMTEKILHATPGDIIRPASRGEHYAAFDVLYNLDANYIEGDEYYKFTIPAYEGTKEIKLAKDY